jgi:ABC-2 type transport system ATP-binding protein
VSAQPIVETEALGKRFGSHWALRDCTLSLPAGSVTALIGPNGAGKTTLLHLLIGLSEPTAGEVRVLGRSPRDDAADVLPQVGFVAQDHPLYRGFTLAELLKVGRKLNPGWDDALATRRVERLGLPLRKTVGTMSGGQQAQIALTLALAKRPALLVLDEPVASLDPLARREFLQGLMEAVAGEGLTVVLSSHIVAELERVCDHLVILASGGVQLEGPIEELLASHRLLTGPRRDAPAVARIETVVQATHTERQTTLLVRTDRALADPSWQVAEVGLEEVVLAYLGLQAGYGTPAQGRLELAS